jgi:hypothetical protein
MVKLNPGDSLKNGAIVINHADDKGLVFAAVSGGPEPYVIWNIDNDGNCTSGIYYSDLIKAANYYGAKVSGALKCF